eukprot:scaffold81389_cov46-Prasinocladus_malaysianus.AAC.2
MGSARTLRPMNAPWRATCEGAFPACQITSLIKTMSVPISYTPCGGILVTSEDLDSDMEWNGTNESKHHQTDKTKRNELNCNGINQCLEGNESQRKETN